MGSWLPGWLPGWLLLKKNPPKTQTKKTNEANKQANANDFSRLNF